MIEAALDTSRGCSLAVYCDSKLLFNEAMEITGRNSDRHLVPYITDALKKHGMATADVNEWSVGTGPGSFSGIRVGVSLIKGICQVSGAKYRGVPSSISLAWTAAETDSPATIGVLHDARRGQMILSAYKMENNIPVATSEARVIDPDEVELTTLDALITIDNIEKLLTDDLKAKLQTLKHVDAEKLCLYNQGQYPEDADDSCEPVYVRPAVFVQPVPLPAIPNEFHNRELDRG